jgi:hypothetical protein
MSTLDGFALYTHLQHTQHENTHTCNIHRTKTEGNERSLNLIPFITMLLAFTQGTSVFDLMLRSENIPHDQSVRRGEHGENDEIIRIQATQKRFGCIVASPRMMIMVGDR